MSHSDRRTPIPGSETIQQPGGQVIVSHVGSTSDAQPHSESRAVTQSGSESGGQAQPVSSHVHCVP